jgi:hypothetical protein
MHKQFTYMLKINAKRNKDYKTIHTSAVCYISAFKNEYTKVEFN